MFFVIIFAVTCVDPALIDPCKLKTTAKYWIERDLDGI